MEEPPPREDTLLLLRFAAFVALNAMLVAWYVDALVGALPPLAQEGQDLIVRPVIIIAVLGFAAMYPLLRRAKTHALRLAVLVTFVVAGACVEAIVFVTSTGGPDPSLSSLVGVAIFGVAVQLLYGAPLFAGMALLNKLASPVLIARPASRWL